MRLYALSAGVEAPTERFNGTIHSVFRHTCNIRLESDILITLLASEQANVPQGIRVDTPLGFTFLSQTRIDQPVACRSGILRISGSDLSIDLRSATYWHLDLRGLRIDRRRDVARAWAVAWNELETCRRGDGMSAIIGALPPTNLSSAQWSGLKALLGKGERSVSAILAATRNFQACETIATMEGLVGLGPGLTPSGDDFLVGYLAGLWSMAGHDASRLQFISTVGTGLAGAVTGTNLISRAYIKSAIQGHVAEPLATLAQQLDGADNLDNVRAATHTALQVGHTSGPDGVFGLLLGMSAWFAGSLQPPEGGNGYAVSRLIRSRTHGDTNLNGRLNRPGP